MENFSMHVATIKQTYQLGTSKPGPPTFSSHWKLEDVLNLLGFLPLAQIFYENCVLAWDTIRMTAPLFGIPPNSDQNRSLHNPEGKTTIKNRNHQQIKLSMQRLPYSYFESTLTYPDAKLTHGKTWHRRPLGHYGFSPPQFKPRANYLLSHMWNIT